MTKIVKYLLISNIIIFLITWFSPTWIHLFGLHDVSNQLYFNFQWVTHMFIHGGITHIILNMLILFMFGPMVENRYGAKKFLIMYLLAGLGGAYLQMQFNHSPETVLIGASGAIFGVLILSALLQPNLKVYLFFLIPMTLKVGIVCILAMEIASAIRGGDGIGHFAHLGGGAVGLLFYLGNKWLQKN